MPYVNCPNCGQKALGVATRCPQCGLPFESQFSQNLELAPKPRRSLLGFLVAGVVIAALIIQEVWRRLPAAPSTPLPPVAVDTSPLPLAQPKPRPEPQAPPQGQSAAPAPARVSPPAPAPVPVTPPVNVQSAEERYANDWVNVRAERSSKAPVVQILRPGAMVLVDTLVQGWYRVVADQQVVGYVDSHFLQANPPAAQP